MHKKYRTDFVFWPLGGRRATQHTHRYPELKYYSLPQKICGYAPEREMHEEVLLQYVHMTTR